MAIPRIPEFEELLSSITRSNPSNPDFLPLTICEEIPEVHANGATSKRSAVLIWYKKDTKLSLEALIRKIVSELKIIGHIANEFIAKSILLLFAIYERKNKHSVDAINEILQTNNSCDISQYFILPEAGRNRFEPISFGDFTIENLDERRFAYKCAKAGSDFFALYGPTLIGKPSIERKVFDTTIINCHELSGKFEFIYHSEILNDCLIYFENVSSAYFEIFWQQFNDQQDMHISFGMPYFPSRFFREKLLGQYITIFSKLPVKEVHRGYVVPIQIGSFQLAMPYDFGPSIRKFYSAIKDQYNFSGFEVNEIHQTFKTFTKFVAKGCRYLSEERMDEGFLHFIIALDLAFGDKEESTKSVANRCAILTAGNNLEFTNQRKKITELYDARSRYVHAGLPVKVELIGEAKEICEKIATCFLKIHSYWKMKEVIFTIEHWKKKLDYACSALEAGENISDNVKAEVGVIF